MIAVFTKYDQFRREIKFKLEDKDPDQTLLDLEIERVFGEQYLANLRGPPAFVRLESKGIVN